MDIDIFIRRTSRLTNERARNLAKEFEIENLFITSQSQDHIMSVSE